MDRDRKTPVEVGSRRRWSDTAAGAAAPSSSDARVLVVGPSGASGAGLSSQLREAGLGVVGEAPAIEHAPAMARRLRPDVILVDLERGPSAVTAIRSIARSVPETQVVLLFTDDELDLAGALHTEAYACIRKDASIDEILAATQAAARGGQGASPSIARVRTLVSQMGAQRRDAAALTKRELEVLELLARGWDNGRIAAGLYMSRATVKRHISSILHKLNVENRIQAAVRAVEEGLLGRRDQP